jgi:hypothetical protein
MAERRYGTRMNSPDPFYAVFPFAIVLQLVERSNRNEYLNTSRCQLLAKIQAAAAGFTSVDEYIANLIRRQPSRESSRSREKALQELRQLRKELPKLGAEEIVRFVQESRADLL